ncbi:MAG TPA: diacylglycerol kinase family protein [Candidatus Saccharimonadales bacterium]|nr:diacylglycerol kinase family protein [Candidatus Saccharimonadales bacterium]
MTRALAIVNPAAGGGTARADVDALLGTLRERFATIDVEETGVESPTAEDLARRGVAEKYDAVLVAGGDGTVGVAARALVNTDVTLGILPFGSFMNIARAVGIPRGDRAAAARIIANGKSRAIDVGRVGEHLFFEAAGIGLDAHAFEAGHAFQRGKRSRAVAAVGALIRRSGVRVRIEADGRAHSHRVLQAVVCNGPWYGWGFEVAPGARIDDGKLELVVFGGGRLAVLRELIAAAIDRDRPARGRRYLGKRIVLSSREPLEVHADGQLVGSLPQTFEALPRALRVYAPASVMHP